MKNYFDKVSVPFAEGVMLDRWKSTKKDELVFLYQQIQKITHHTNPTQALKAAKCIEGEDYLVLHRKTNLGFFKELARFYGIDNQVPNLKLGTNNPFAGKDFNMIPSLTFVYESGFWKLAMTSRLESGDKLREWLAVEVLPSIRKTGMYKLPSVSPFKNIERHTDRAVQVTNSKQVNGYNFLKGGVQAVIEHNVENCVVHTGKTPSEIKQLAKEWNVPSKHRSSAKEVMRKYHPEVACSMSVADEFVRLGKDSHDAAIMCKEHAVPLFKEMLAYNMINANDI